MGDCCLTPSANILSYVIARTNHTLMRWWWYQLFLTNTLSCIFYSANPMKQQSGGRHVIPFGRIILISIQPVIAIALWCCMLRGETVCTNYIVLVWTDWGSQPTICHTEGEHRKKTIWIMDIININSMIIFDTCNRILLPDIWYGLSSINTRLFRVFPKSRGINDL